MTFWMALFNATAGFPISESSDESRSNHSGQSAGNCKNQLSWNNFFVVHLIWPSLSEIPRRGHVCHKLRARRCKPGPHLRTCARKDSGAVAAFVAHNKVCVRFPGLRVKRNQMYVFPTLHIAEWWPAKAKAKAGVPRRTPLTVTATKVTMICLRTPRKKVLVPLFLLSPSFYTLLHSFIPSIVIFITNNLNLPARN